MALEADIVDRVRADFGPAEASTALDDLQLCGKTGRVARCIILAAGGSLARLRELIDIANTDYRDAIVAGEYDDAMRQVRDLRVSFLIDSPDGFWVGEFALAIYKHGYCLTDLKSQPASVGPFDYTCDRGEGLATFSNGTNTISVQKRDRKWSVVEGGSHLHRYGLDEVHDEESFRVQMDYYFSRL